MSNEGSEVFMRRDPKSREAILSCKPDSWAGLLQLNGRDEVPGDFMGPQDRARPPHVRDPFEGWKE